MASSSDVIALFRLSCDDAALFSDVTFSAKLTQLDVDVIRHCARFSFLLSPFIYSSSLSMKEVNVSSVHLLVFIAIIKVTCDDEFSLCVRLWNCRWFTVQILHEHDSMLWNFVQLLSEPSAIVHRSTFKASHSSLFVAVEGAIKEEKCFPKTDVNIFHLYSPLMLVTARQKDMKNERYKKFQFHTSIACDVSSVSRCAP